MYSLFLRKTGLLLVFVIILAGCNTMDDNPAAPHSSAFDESTLNGIDETVAGNGLSKEGFVHGIVISVDGEDYYFAGAPDGPDGETDIPGHSWVQTSPTMLVGKHYNTGPFGAAKWWSSDAEDGEYLYKVHAIIDTWTQAKAEAYATQGYVHYHELITVSDGTLHPDKVVWLKHTARIYFTLDGGPGAPDPPYEHAVTPGVDLLFPVNGLEPYNP